MFHAFLRTLVKTTVACLIVGAIMTHFGITPDDARGAVADARLGKEMFPHPHTGEIAIGIR